MNPYNLDTTSDCRHPGKSCALIEKQFYGTSTVKVKYSTIGTTWNATVSSNVNNASEMTYVSSETLNPTIPCNVNKKANWGQEVPVLLEHMTLYIFGVVVLCKTSSIMRQPITVSLKPDRTTARTTAHPNCCRWACMYDWTCTTVHKHDHTCTECPLLQIFKNALVVGRVGSGVRVSGSFHILSCAVVRAVARSCCQILGTPTNKHVRCHIQRWARPARYKWL